MSGDVQFAKKHIRNRFSLLVLPHVNEGLWSVYENARTVCEKNRQVDQTLRTFQNLLTFIPKWDEDRLRAEVERIQTASGCTYLEELLTATILTYLRAFAAVQYTSSTDIEVEFERPPLPRFIHELYKEAARQCWTHAYLFKTYSVSNEQQARNRREIEGLLEQALDTTFDSFLPWKAILDKYFKEPAAPTSAPIAPTEIAQEEEEHQEEEEEEEEKPSVKFAIEEEEEEEQPTLTLSEEAADVDLKFDSLEEDKKPKEDEDEIDLTPSDEQLVLNL